MPDACSWFDAFRPSANSPALARRREQVDAKALGLKDYNEIVTQPMDLGTVTERLANGEYSKEEEFVDDVLLTFNNATKYNPVGNEIHMIAVQLRKRFRELWTKLRPSECLDSSELNGTWTCHHVYHFGPVSLSSLLSRDTLACSV